MNIRISGSPDLVRAWAARFETHLGIKWREYPNRNIADIRTVGDRGQGSQCLT